MTDPRRFGEPWDRFEEDLLRSAKGDVPAGDAQAKVLVTLGVGRGGALVAGKAGASAASAGAAGSGASPLAAATAKLALVGSSKWVALAVLGLSLGVASTVMPPAPTESKGAVPNGFRSTQPVVATAPRKVAVTPVAARHAEGHFLETQKAGLSRSAPSAMAPTIRTRAAHPTLSAPAGRTTADSSPASRLTPSLDPARTEDAIADAPATRVPETAVSSLAADPLRPPSIPNIESQLARETASLDAARAALAANETTLARRALDEYVQAFPDGVLTQEATLLRIELLLAQGNRAQAVQLARELITTFPNSPHARRLRAFLGL